MLGPPEDEDERYESFYSQHEGGYLLELVQEEPYQSVGLLALRPRLARGVDELVTTARRYGVSVELLPSGSPAAAQFIGKRAGITVLPAADMVDTIQARQHAAGRVTLVSDHAEAGPGFAACDLAIGLASARNGDFPARADILATDLRSLSHFLETGHRRMLAVRDGVCFSGVVNSTGLVLALTQGLLGGHNAAIGVYVGALGSLGASWWRLRGGHRPETNLAYLTDPRPERWGRLTVAEVLHAFTTSPTGLSDATARSRRVSGFSSAGSYAVLSALRNQLKAPVTSLLAGGDCLTLVLGQPLNTALLGLTISLNVVAGIWQEREVGKAADALRNMSAGSARVVRNNTAVTLPVPDLVPGDILLLGPGDRIAADARMIEATSLEIDEAALTGESLPVPKGPSDAVESARIILEGSDVVAGTGKAVVVAVGRRTRLGATAAALNVERSEESPMGTRLGRILHIALPVAGIGGALAGLAGLIYGDPLAAQATVAVTTALAAIPEGLPLLSGVGQAAVARRLASKRALVRRIAAIEALGRVDVACTDKTGTMTEGRLSLRVLADGQSEASFPVRCRPRFARCCSLREWPARIPRAGALHPTDNAVVRAAVQAGLETEIHGPGRPRSTSTRPEPFMLRLWAPQMLTDACASRGPPNGSWRGARISRRPAGNIFSTTSGRRALLDRVVSFAERGLRMLLVAEGPGHADPEDPQGLCVLGFLGISDPLRATVPLAVSRCQEAGIRVVMLTGDHPATARAIAQEAGLLPKMPANCRIRKPTRSAGPPIWWTFPRPSLKPGSAMSL